MPGILSRDAYLYRKRGSSSIASSTTSKSSGSDSSWTSSWGSSWGSPRNIQTPLMSRTSLASNSPSHCAQLPFAAKRRRTSEGGNVVVDEIHRQPVYKESRDDQDSWGQFIDTAEAEDEMIRHSKILFKRYLMQKPSMD